jgi:hypothetical protein
MADVSILDPSVHAAPKGYTVKGAQEIVLRTVTATIDGTAAAGSFVPCVQLVDPSGFVTGTYTLGSTLLAGAAADVTWFPGVTPPATGGTHTQTLTLPVRLDTPDVNGNAYPGLTTQNGFTNVRRIVNFFQHGLDGFWTGGFRIPADYSTGGSLILEGAANATTGNVRLNVSTHVSTAGTQDAAYTAEAFVNHTVPGTALVRDTLTFVLSTTPVAGSYMHVQVERNGTSGSDTLTVDYALFLCSFSYTANS